MPLFRLHRGELAESLETTVIVKSIPDIIAVLCQSDLIRGMAEDWGDWKPEFKIEPYPTEDNFDARIGWYTHIVLANIFERDKMHPVGFLSEPLE